MEEMGLKACQTCQASCGGSVSRGLNYRIRGLFEIFFLLSNCHSTFLQEGQQGPDFPKNNQTCRLFHGGLDHQFSESHPSSWKIAPVQGAQNLGCCRVVGGLHCEAGGYGCFKRMKIGGWCGYVVEP